MDSLASARDVNADVILAYITRQPYSRGSTRSLSRAPRAFSEVSCHVTIDSGVRILIVDDDRGIRHTLRAVLEDEGYAVLEAGDGVDGLEMMRTSPHHLVVLLDLRMPGLDGAGVLEAVAADARLARRHAFILVTANLDAITPACSTLLHRLDVPIVPKPFDLDPLLDLVDRAACGLLATATDPSIPTRQTAR